MAMEKLILRSVMYGVDKIPDSWFDKVPGGFYKSNQKNGKKDGEGRKLEGGDGSKKPRRHGRHHDDRRRGRRDRYEDEYRSDDNRRQERRGRNSYDGSHDDDRYERREAREGGRRRRRHSVDSERYGYDDGYIRAPPNAYHGDGKVTNSKPATPPDPYFDDRQRPATGDSNRSAPAARPKTAAAVGTGFATAAAAEAGAPYPQTRSDSVHLANTPSPHVEPAQPPPPTAERPRSGSTANGYVPYAHIYSQPNTRPNAQPTFAPPPTSSLSSGSPRTAPDGPRPTSAYPQGYQQDPFAQQAPTAADAGAGARYNAQPGFAPPNSARAFAGYENTPPYLESPRPGRSTDKYSPSYASGHRRDSDVRRTRSERRPDSSSKGRDRHQGESPTLWRHEKRRAYLPLGKETHVDRRAPVNVQVSMPPPPSGPPPQPLSSSKEKDERRDSAQQYDRPRSSYRHNDRGYTSD